MKEEDLRLRSDTAFVRLLDNYVAALKASGKEANRSTVIREAVRAHIKANPPPPPENEVEVRKGLSDAPRINSKKSSAPAKRGRGRKRSSPSDAGEQK